MDDADTTEKLNALAKKGEVARYPLPPGTLLRKLDIAAHFFQVYGLILLMAYQLAWPTAWQSVKSIYDWPAYLALVEIRDMFVLAGFTATRESYEVTDVVLQTFAVRAAANCI